MNEYFLCRIDSNFSINFSGGKNSLRSMIVERQLLREEVAGVSFAIMAPSVFSARYA